MTDSTDAPAPLLASNLGAIAGVRHGFFTRAGGVSGGIYAGLNCGFGSNDDPRCVAENRARVARHLGGVVHDRVLTLHQVHSATAVVVQGDIARPDLPKADGLVTSTRGLAIAALAADCAPVLFADPVVGVIAAAHAGWRGAVGGVVEATIGAMETLGATRGSIRACVGPCISQANYEVGAEFEAHVVGLDAANRAYFTKPTEGARSHFDLPRYVADRLVAAGLGSVERQSLCTYADESIFYSFRRSTHRKEPDYGRQISAIVLI